MDSSPFIMIGVFCGLLLATFWLYLYCYALYRLGRWIAQRFRTRPVPTFAGIALASALLTLPVFFLPFNFDGHYAIVAKATVVFLVFNVHAFAVGAGLWGGMELGKRSDDKLFWVRTEDWLKEWEDPPVPKWLKDDHGDN